MLCRQSGQFKTARLPKNSQKNRYDQILPNEKTRVKLTCTLSNHPQHKEPCNDYINANLINGKIFGLKHSYIATQAPLPCTFDDFWRMIWEHNCRVIIMLEVLSDDNIDEILYTVS